MYPQNILIINMVIECHNGGIVVNLATHICIYTHIWMYTILKLTLLTKALPISWGYLYLYFDISVSFFLHFLFIV